jgi:diadenosine tetraphosphate (Ap4A) HIT family hydrolase
MIDWRQDRVGSALRGENPTVLAHLPQSFAVIGDVRWLPGYCLLLTDDPAVDRLTDLPRPRRVAFLESMERLGEAVERACAATDPAFRRINLEILGNTDPFLHAHIWPRYEWEPPELVGRPVWLYPTEHWKDPATALGPRHDAIRVAIKRQLAEQ